MSDARTYVCSVLEDSLGLVRGALDPSVLTEDLVVEFSLAVKGAHPNGLPTPVLEERMRKLLATVREKALREDGYFVRKARWPGGARFAACLTHDVDNVTHSRGHLWKTRSRFSPWDVLGGTLGLTNPYDNLLLIASKERELGFRSSYYLLTSNYPLPRLGTTVQTLRSAGWEVGLHGDFGTHDSLANMQGAVSRFSGAFGFRPTGVREHYLKFDYAQTWKVMKDAGFEYDTTVGNNDRIGFKVGLASPFHPPDESWQPMELLELPLILMDTTLWGYLKRTEDEGFSDFLAVSEAVERVEGLLTLLWHQEAVRMRGGRIYWRVLRELKERGCYVGSGAQVARWWKQRAVPLVRDGKLIRLAGPIPRELVLELTLAEGRSPVVRSGAIGARQDSYAVRPTGKDFQLEVV